MHQRVVSVSPPGALSSGSRLFGALAKAFNVRFERSGDPRQSRADAAIVLPGGGDAGPVHLSTLIVVAPERRAGARAGLVSLRGDTELDARLRNRQLVDDGAGGLAPVPADDGVVLATCDAQPLWVRRFREDGSRVDVVASWPSELGEEESLRNRLRAGRFIALLPVAEFLRDLTRETAWTPPPLRAAFIMDDPNLHWASYGHINYPELARAARRDGYHVAMAMIPLDGWHANRRAVETFSSHPDELSLLCHGNDHVRHELAIPRADVETEAILAQAIRRLSAFEHRAKLRVDRVMAAPHERCSETSIRWLLRLGFEALCNSRPYPWRSSPLPGRALAGWHSADLIGNGLPVLPRYSLHHPRDDLVFRAYLDQPLVLYGHHEDVEGGLDVLGEAAGDINRLGSVRWTSLERIARTNFAKRRVGTALELRSFSRLIDLDIPAGIDSLSIQIPDVDGEPDWSLGASGHTTPLVRDGWGWRSERSPPPAPGRHQIAVKWTDAVDPVGVPAPRPGAGPLLRRGLTEVRDRLRPGVTRIMPSGPRDELPIDLGLARD